MSRNEKLNGAPFVHATKGRNDIADEFNRRKFEPCKYGFRSDALPTEVFVSNTDCCPLLHVEYTRKFPMGELPFNFVLYADGACLGNGTPAARASIGVYGTPDAWYNTGLRLPSHVPQTSQSAEIYSAIFAIKVARDILNTGRPGSSTCGCDTVFVLVMDSEYVVNAMTKWIGTWRSNGFRNAHGKPVANAEAMKRLDHDIRQVLLDRSLVVRFWHVDRMYNSGANKMAAQAFQRNHFLDLSPVYPHSAADSDDLEARGEVCSAFSGLAIAGGF